MTHVDLSEEAPIQGCWRGAHKDSVSTRWGESSKGSDGQRFVRSRRDSARL